MSKNEHNQAEYDRGYAAGLQGEKGWDSLHSDSYNEGRRAGNAERKRIEAEESIRESVRRR